MSEVMIEVMSEWMKEQTSEWMNEWTNERMNEGNNGQSAIVNTLKGTEFSKKRVK